MDRMFANIFTVKHFKACAQASVVCLIAQCSAGSLDTEHLYELMLMLLDLCS